MTGEFPLQNLIFPSGLGYDKHNNKVQTSETNEFLALIHLLSTEIDEIKNGDSIKKDQISALVTPRGNSSPPKAAAQLNFLRDFEWVISVVKICR